MSGAASSEDAVVKSAVPVADLSILDGALAGGEAELRAALRTVRPADVGRELSRRDDDDGCKLIAASDDRRAAAILRAAHPSIAARLMAKIDPARCARILPFVPTDHQVAILGVLDREDRERIEQALSPEDRETVTRLLAHPETAVGRLMTPKIWRCDKGKTVADAMAELHANREDIEVAVNLYLTDGKKLVGVMPLREVSITPPETPLASVMTPDPIAVREDTERADAAEIIQIHDFLSLPVVNAAGELVGAVRVDDLLDAAFGRLGAGLLNQGAVAGRVAALVPYFRTSLFTAVRSRITWLVLLFVAETLTGTVLRVFEDELARVVALSFFVPLLIGTGGNAGSQTVSTIIRALALGEVRTRDVARVLMKEVSTGAVLGVLLGAIAFGRALLWGVGMDLAACVAITILAVCTWATTVGAVIPIAAQSLKIDPTVVSAPLITTLVDASGLLIYFLIAHICIAQLHAEPKPLTPPPQEMSELYALAGKWQCQGTLPESKGPTTMDLEASVELDRYWLSLTSSEEVKDQGWPLASQELWGWDREHRVFIRDAVDNRGRFVHETSPGWQGDVLTWSGAMPDVRVTRHGPERFDLSGGAGAQAWSMACTQM